MTSKVCFTTGRQKNVVYVASMVLSVPEEAKVAFCLGPLGAGGPARDHGEGSQDRAAGVIPPGEEKARI